MGWYTGPRVEPNGGNAAVPPVDPNAPPAKSFDEEWDELGEAIKLGPTGTAVVAGTIFSGGALFAYMRASANINAEMGSEVVEAAEIEIQKEAQRLARRALGLATVLNFGAIFASTWAVSHYLSVGLFDEFSAKMRVIVPQKMEPVQDWIRTIDLPQPGQWRPAWLGLEPIPVAELPSAAQFDPTTCSRRYGFYDGPP